MKIIWYPVGGNAAVRGPYYVSPRRRDQGVIEIKCTFVSPHNGTYTQSGYNIARVEDVPIDQYELVAENVRLMAEMGLYKNGN